MILTALLPAKSRYPLLLICWLSKLARATVRPTWKPRFFLSRAFVLTIVWLHLNGAITSAESFDAMIAAVNDHVLCRSYVVMVQKFLASAALCTKPVSESQDQILERLIKRLLILGEIRRTGEFLYDYPAVESYLTLRFGPASARKTVEQELAGIGWTLDAYRTWIAEDLMIDRFIQERFIAFMVVSEEDVAARVQVEFGGKDQNLDPSTINSLVRELVLQERLNAKLEEWVRELRSRAEIYIVAE